MKVWHCRDEDCYGEHAGQEGHCPLCGGPVVQVATDSYDNDLDDCASMGTNPHELCWGVVGYTEEVFVEETGDVHWGYLCAGHMPEDTGKPYEEEK